MGNPHTIDVCINCGEKVINWNNEGRWEHLASGTDDPDKSRAYITGANQGLGDPAVCNNPRLEVEENSKGKKHTQRVAKPRNAG